MTMMSETTKAPSPIPALVELLRGRSYDEIRQRMYDNPPGSQWWIACKLELDARNNEQMATTLADTSRVLDKIRNSAEHMDSLTGRLLQATGEMTELLKSARESGRRMEIAVYVILGVAVLQLFYIAFQISGRH